MNKTTNPSIGEQFTKNKKIAASLPAASWLQFLKKYILKGKPKQSKIGCVFALIPIVLFGVLGMLSIIDYEVMIGLLIASVIISIIAFAFVYGGKSNFVHLPVFHDLARFIIHIKGDLKNDTINLRINAGAIQKDENLLDSAIIGVKDTRTTKYKPYQLERYYGSFSFKDGSYGAVSLLQITIRVRSTKRRSSGKTKTKVKFKHKLFYQLSLKLPKNLYRVINTGRLENINPLYDISISESAKYYVVKIKQKEKKRNLADSIVMEKQNDASNFTKMIDYLYTKNIISPTTQNTISQH